MLELFVTTATILVFSIVIGIVISVRLFIDVLKEDNDYGSKKR